MLRHCSADGGWQTWDAVLLILADGRVSLISCPGHSRVCFGTAHKLEGCVMWDVHRMPGGMTHYEILQCFDMRFAGALVVHPNDKL